MKKIGFFFLTINLGLFSCFKENLITPQAQLKADTTSIDAFLKQNNILATKIPSGVWYAFDSVGIGVYPVLTDSVKISYTAYLIASSKQTVSSLQQVGSSPSPSVTVLLSSVIAGLQLTLPNFPNGSSGELFIPSGLAFGASTNPSYSIPPNANLLYKIELLGVKGTQLASDQTVITNYISSIADSLAIDSIAVITEPISGLRYSIDSAKNHSPHVVNVSKDSVVVNYSFKILNASTWIKSDTTVAVPLKSQITGWKILIPKIPQGAKATLYIASGFGYGGVAHAKLPANSNLLYQINLVKVIHHP